MQVTAGHGRESSDILAANDKIPPTWRNKIRKFLISR